MIEGRGLTLTPGLVNGHTHAAMTLFRGYGDDLPLMDWLRTRIWPAEAALTADDVYWGTRLAALEMIRSGTTCFWDMYWFQFDVARAVVDAGLRAVVSVPVIESPDAPEWNHIDAVPEGLDRLGGFGQRVTPSLAAHAIYTVGADSLRRLATLSAERDVPFQIHLSETSGEVDDCLAAHGVRPTVYLDQLGALNERTVLSHGVWLDDAELALIAERGADDRHEPGVEHEARHGSGVSLPGGARGRGADRDRHRRRGLEQLARSPAGREAPLPPAEARRPAIPQCSRPPTRGRSSPDNGLPVSARRRSQWADRPTSSSSTSAPPESTPSEPVAGLVYSATGAAVDTVVVDGVVLMERRRVPGEDEVVANAARCAARLRMAVPAG